MIKTVKFFFITGGFFLFTLSAFLLFEPSTNPTGFFVYTPTLAIVNSNNNIPVNSNLEIQFMTKGTNDLIITPLGNIKFLELRCNDNVLITNNLHYKDYNCDGDSYLLVKVLSSKVELEFKFGNNIQQAINIAS